MALIFDKSVEGRRGVVWPESDVPQQASLPKKYQRQHDCDWPQVTELDAIRHFTKLSQKNFSIDTHFYPLGSCTMKYNPKFTEKVARLAGFSDLHPLLPQLPKGETLTQGALQVLYELEQNLKAITGMVRFTLQPLAGAHGELTGVMMMAAYHKARGNKKRFVIVPDSSHGTNPATVTIAGYEILPIPSTAAGVMDLRILEASITPEVAGLMLTCPNTHGIFNSDIDRIAKMIHDVDGIMYYDGANLNAILGRCRPGDIGFDVMHINTHKTFATPHGGGGPGAGPVGVGDKLVPYLPISLVEKLEDGRYHLNYDCPESIGYLSAFYGNFALLLRAYAYIRLFGQDGLKGISDYAVLSANYIKERLKKVFDLPYDRSCAHECVFSASKQAARGVHAIDIAKFLIDEGIHPPTVYFPLTVKEAMMIEPTESESKQSIDRFVDAMEKADALSQATPEVFKTFPQTTPISRPDEVQAARELNTNYFQ